MEDKGFMKTRNLNFSGKADVGYTTGVMYIKSWIPKVKRNVKSLYFVVKEEKIIPIPKANIAINIINIGVNKIHQLGWTASVKMT